MDEDADRLAVFPSALGWMAVQTRGPTLIQLSFGLASPEKALAALEQRLAAGATIGQESSELSERLQAYAVGARDDFRDVKLDPGSQTEFQRRVVQKCRRISYGRMLTYGELAQAAGFPRAARAVGSVMRTNRTPLVVPCHRVVASSGKPGGYSAGEGVRMKLRLLELEGFGASPPDRNEIRPGI
ncbi:MAG TPA: methylated-DNA--[protein]-cysteine S-methyltransferase [Pirellulales bacterium]|nr:methylated-DNA--[protein]-cysteine S-methyltransferase [Pirellulales bacterium]